MSGSWVRSFLPCRKAGISAAPSSSRLLVSLTGPKEVEEWEPHERLPPTSLREALRRFLDITTPPTQQFLSLLSSSCSDETEKESLKTLSTDSQKYEEWKAFHFPTFYEVLQLFPSLDPPAELIFTQVCSHVKELMMTPDDCSLVASPLATILFHQLVASFHGSESPAWINGKWSTQTIKRDKSLR